MRAPVAGRFFGTAKIYEKDPLLQMRKFSSAGASWLHMVDLDGAREGEMRQIDLITNLAKQTPLRIQAGAASRAHEPSRSFWIRAFAAS